MPYHRRRFRRRRPRRHTRYRKRRGRVHRPVSRNQGVLSCKQAYQDIYTIPSADMWAPNYQTFSLDQIDATQLANWQRVFNQFRINYVTVKFLPIISSPTGLAGDTQLSTMYTAITTNSNANSSDWPTENNALVTSNVRTHYIGRYNITKPGVTIAFKPRTHFLVHNPGSAFIGKAVTPRPGTWLNLSGDTSVVHSGLRFGWQFDAPHPIVEFKQVTTFYLQFRNVI